MEKTEDGRVQEVGRVYIYLQKTYGMEPGASAVLTGHQEFGRFGSAIASLGDLNQDGYNGMKVGSEGHGMGKGTGVSPDLSCLLNQDELPMYVFTQRKEKGISCSLFANKRFPLLGF